MESYFIFKGMRKGACDRENELNRYCIQRRCGKVSIQDSTRRLNLKSARMRLVEDLPLKPCRVDNCSILARNRNGHIISQKRLRRQKSFVKLNVKREGVVRLPYHLCFIYSFFL